MANRMPSMLALLGLLAVAGYQNRDKIAEALKGSQSRGSGSSSGGGLDGLLGGLGGLLGGATGGSLAGGLGELLNTFKSSGQSETADSWVRPGVPTRGLSPRDVEQAIGEDSLTELSRATGLSRGELLERLATNIPETVDRMTPDGRMPTDEEARRFFS
jgi:uncharacterized protein YidB (DUF937 family)